MRRHDLLGVIVSGLVGCTGQPAGSSGSPDGKTDSQTAQLTCTVKASDDHAAKLSKTVRAKVVGNQPIELSGSLGNGTFAVSYKPQTRTATLTASSVVVTGALATGQPLTAKSQDFFEGHDELDLACSVTGIAPTVHVPKAPTAMVCSEKGNTNEQRFPLLPLDGNGFIPTRGDYAPYGMRYDAASGQLTIDSGLDTDSPEVPFAAGVAIKDSPLTEDGIAADGFTFVRCYVE
jgi:hypothetical protein